MHPRPCTHTCTRIPPQLAVEQPTPAPSRWHRTLAPPRRPHRWLQPHVLTQLHSAMTVGVGPSSVPRPSILHTECHGMLWSRWGTHTKEGLSLSLPTQTRAGRCVLPRGTGCTQHAGPAAWPANAALRHGIKHRTRPLLTTSGRAWQHDHRGHRRQGQMRFPSGHKVAVPHMVRGRQSSTSLPVISCLASAQPSTGTGAHAGPSWQGCEERTGALHGCA